MFWSYFKRSAWPVITLVGLFPLLALAHEAYVVDKQDFWQGLDQPISSHALDAWRDPHNVAITIYVALGVTSLLVVNFFFRLTRIGKAVHAWPERFARFGPIIIRATIAGALFFSATSNSFLGPELNLNQFATPDLFRWSLLLISIMIAIGLLTEIAALLGIILFASAFKIIGPYIFSYTSYLGELFVLLLFGMRRWSVDAHLFGKLSQLREKLERYESTIVRIFYGFALIYAGITVKLLHPDLTLKVATDWNLAQFHWLFPSDPLLITLGAGLAEVAIGLLIIMGFELRLTVLVSLFYITLSLLFFRELVWPHLLLYGISINLLLQPETFTIDHLLFDHHRRHYSWWLRPLLPHHNKGKSVGNNLRPEPVNK